MLDLDTHIHTHTMFPNKQPLERDCKRPPGVTYSLFTYRGRLAASACCAQPCLCRRDVSGSDERGHLCGETSLFTLCRSFLLLTWTNTSNVSVFSQSWIHGSICPEQCWTVTENKVIYFSSNEKYVEVTIDIKLGSDQHLCLSRWPLCQISRYDLLWFGREMSRTMLNPNQY